MSTTREQAIEAAMMPFVNSFNGDEAGDINNVMSVLGDTGWAMNGGNDLRAVLGKAFDALIAAGLIRVADNTGDDYARELTSRWDSLTVNDSPFDILNLGNRLITRLESEARSSGVADTTKDLDHEP